MRGGCLRGAAPLLLLLPLLSSCPRGATPPSTTGGRLPTLPAPAEEQVVARVNGTPITAEQVRAQAQAAQQSAKDALSALVRAELLAQEADRRGLYDAPDVQRAGRSEMVRKYLYATFEHDVTAENTVPESDIKKAYNQAIGRLVHPLLKDVEHLLVMSADPSKPEQCAAADGAALSQKVYAAARSAKDSAQFKAIGDDTALKDEAAAKGCGLRYEHLVTGRQGWTVEEFAKVAYELKAPGDVSAPVKTSFGHHVVRLVQDIAAENITLEEATPKIRKDMWPTVRVRAFERFQAEIAKGHAVETFPDNLKALAPPQ